jgi:hypothetical protein
MDETDTIGRFKVPPPKTKTGRPSEPKRPDEMDDQYQSRLKNREKMRRYRENNPTYFRDWHRVNKHRLKRRKDSKEVSQAKGRRRYARAQQWFDDIRRGIPCADCDRVFEPCVMDFDHRPGEEKLLAVSQAAKTGIKRQRVLDEIEKCDLVCCNCHRIRGQKRRRAVEKAWWELPENGNAARQRRANQKRVALLASIKDVPCADCDERFPPECMDFDHRPDEVKKFTVGPGRRVGIDRLMAEIAKCDIVCSNCHRMRTHVERAEARNRVA